MISPQECVIFGGAMAAILAIIGALLIWARAERGWQPPTFDEHAADACAHTTGGIYIPPNDHEICDALEWQFQNTDTPGGPQ